MSDDPPRHPETPDGRKGLTEALRARTAHRGRPVNWGLVAVICFGSFAVAWLAINQTNHTARVDQLDDDERRHHDDLTTRLERAEDWIRYLADERNRPWIAPPPDLAPYPEPTDFAVHVVHVDADETGPATVPIVLPDEGPATQPSQAVIADGWRDLDAMYAEAMANIEAMSQRSEGSTA